MFNYNNKYADSSTIYAAVTLDSDMIKRTQDYPDLHNLMAEHDFCAENINKISSPTVPIKGEFSETRKIYLPEELLNNMSNEQDHRRMGLWPEINCVWMTVLDTLYIWNMHCGDVHVIHMENYENNDILAVALVHCKPGFEIGGKRLSDSLLLVISTHCQVIVRAVRSCHFTKRFYGVYPEGLLIEDTEDLEMIFITGTFSGRIFMIGNDNNVYEFVYDNPGEDDYWFYNKKHYRIECKSMSWYQQCIIQYTEHVPFFNNILNHERPAEPFKSLVIDNERNVMYMIRGSSSIEVVYLGDKQQDDYKSIIVCTNIVIKAMRLCGGYSKRCFHQLKSLHVISKLESKKLHLMALTTAGFRLYFTHFSKSLMSNPDITKRHPTSLMPTTLELCHVRPPKKDDANFIYSKSCYDFGIFLSAKTLQNDDQEQGETIVEVTSIATDDVGRYGQAFEPNNDNKDVKTKCIYDYIEETNTCIKTTPFKVWSLAEVASPLSRDSRPPRIKEISQMPWDCKREFMVLTSNSVTFFQKSRPVDLFIDIVNSSSINNAKENMCKAFMERYGHCEFCCMCFITLGYISDTNVEKKVLEMLSKYANVPVPRHNKSANHLVADKITYDFNGIYKGVSFYVARILGPVWTAKLFRNWGAIMSTYHGQYYKEELQKVKFLLDRLQRIIGFLYSQKEIYKKQYTAVSPIGALLEFERRSFEEMFIFLAQCIEVINFIQLFYEAGPRFPGVSNERREHYFSLDIENIMTTSEGKERILELGIYIIGQPEYNSDLPDIQFVPSLENLQCSYFFEPKDFIFLKGVHYMRLADFAREQLIDSLKKSNSSLISDLLNESVKYFKQAIDVIPSSKMSVIYDMYINRFSYSVGVEELKMEQIKKVHHRI